MRQKVPSSQPNISSSSHLSSSFSASFVLLVPWIFIATVFLMSGCASPQTMAWNHYEEGMLLVYKGYDAKGDKSDKVEKAFNKAIECNKDIPGARASLGTYLAKKGETASALALWAEEAKMHPESQKAMDIVLEKNKAQVAEELASSSASGTGASETTAPKSDERKIEPENKEAKSA